MYELKCLDCGNLFKTPVPVQMACGCKLSEFICGLCFYVIYEHGNIKSWRVVTTNHDLDAADGLINFITELEEKHTDDLLLTYWRKLKT